MKRELNTVISHSGLMQAYEFKQWYNYLKCRLSNEWSVEEVAFLLGKPDFYYADFEKMYNVKDFLRVESERLTTLYQSVEQTNLAFHDDQYGSSENRLVRLRIEKEPISRVYTFTIPWELKVMNDHHPTKKLSLEEWNEVTDLELMSDTLLHARLELDKLFKRGYFLVGKSPDKLYNEIKKTEISKINIKPRHIKQAVYLLIQQGKIVVRRKADRFAFYEYQ